MNDDDDVQRFDIDNVQIDPKGDPIIPRIYFTIPRKYRKRFIQIMRDEIRSMPSDLLNAIFVRAMTQIEAEEAAAIKAMPGDERRRTPDYSPRPRQSADGQGQEQSSGA